MVRISLCASCLLLFILTACSIGFQPPSEPPLDFDPEYLNRQISLQSVESVWPLKTDGPLSILLVSHRTNKIVFPSNFNMRIFYQEDRKWTEIQDRPTTYYYDQVVMGSEGPVPYQQIVGFWPQYPDSDKTYFMRLYVFGNMSTTEGAKDVAAFVDFVVRP